jgi:2-polyprenyl-6-methoxyphenol hydroxylase-like FAD-dependent oxidoreductase
VAKVGEHAIVLGASMGGLVAARVLADHFESVTVVERDLLPHDAANRRGVPQGRHVHALLGRGCQVLRELFPGFTEELTAAGAPSFDYTDLSEVYFNFAGHEFPQTGGFTGLPPVITPSRPLLENLVRRRVRAIPNVTLFEGYDVVGLTASPGGDRVTGARIRPHNGDGEQALSADLVVDATGRGARTPGFLDSLGYGRPPEDRVRVRLSYSSQLLRIPPGTLREVTTIVSPTAQRSTGMVLLGYENDTWMFTVFGMAGCEPPSGLAEMVAFAEGLAPPHILAAVAAGEAVVDGCRFHYPESRWRRYDKMRRFPDGLLVLGDALCSFNPIYGQGMSVAALQAQALAQCLERGRDDLARRYFRAAAKPIGVAWRFAVGGDLSLPQVEGRRPLSVRVSNSYVERLQTAAETDSVVSEQLTRVIAFLDPPSRLLSPRIALRMLRGGRRAPSRPVEPVPTG